MNEPRKLSQNLDEEVIVEIMGEQMYSRAYIEQEVVKTFIPLGFAFLKLSREIISTEQFGIEHYIRFLLEKKL